MTDHVPQEGAPSRTRSRARQPVPESSPVVRTARTASHLVAEGLRGLLVAPGQVLACFLSLAVASCLVTLFAAYGSLAVRWLDRAAERSHLLVYLKEGVASDRVEAVIARLRDRPDVADVRYFSAGEDRARNAALLPADLAASLPTDRIPGEHGLEVRISGTPDRPPDIEGMTALVAGIEEVDIVAGPPVGAERIRAIAAAVRFARVAMTLLSALLLISTVFFVVGNVTRTMERRREEMAILRLVGATSAYLKIPLHVQGVVQGVSGVVAGVLFALLVLQATDAWLREELAMSVRLAFSWGPALLASAGIGAAVGGIGAMLATARRLP